MKALPQGQSDGAPMEPPAEKEGKKHAGAKDISLFSMALGAAWIGLLSLAKAFWFVFPTEKAFGLTMGDIALSGLLIAAIFSPVYLSIILEKVKEIKFGG